MATGITKLHSKGCPAREGRRCKCNAGYQAGVFSKREAKKIRKTFATEAEAKTWRADAHSALSRGGLRAPKPTTVWDAWEAWHQGAKDGTVRNRSGDPYKPSAVRGYERAMQLRVLPEFGPTKLADIRRPDLQEFVDGLLTEGLNSSTIQGTLLPLRAICRRAVGRGELAINPCDGLTMPAVRSRRDRFASPDEAAALIAALPVEARAPWATAMYAGLRRGELQALRVEDVDLASGVIRVERGWDYHEGAQGLKSNAGRRKVPLAIVLRDPLTDHLLRSGRGGSDLLFGATPEIPFGPEKLQREADRAWREAGLDRITPHECRHTFASLMIAAGVNAKALSTYMGHANISITLDRYGHLMPGNEEEAAGLLDSYLTAQQERADEQARAADTAAV
jgi:integrase